MSVTVDVVIPTYNVDEYVHDAVLSAVEQTYPSNAVAVIVVDDGSTDRTVDVVEQLMRDHDNVTLLRSDHSGSPATPRNLGIEHGTGDYVFFLDGDDTLDPRALEGMIETAEDLGSDVVLGKLDGMNERAVPSSMFAETVLDADLVEHNLFFALGPTKLFRRSLIEKHHLRFPTDIRVGQDQTFVAEALLLASKVSVLADRTYYYARFADDRTRHLSQTFETATQIVHRTRRVADIVAGHTEPGERRAMLLRRPLGLNLPRAFGASLAAMPPDEQESAVAAGAELLRELGDPRTLASLDVRKRIVLALVEARATSALLDLHDERAAGDRRDLVARGDGWFVAVPDSVIAVLGEEACRATAPVTLCSLSRLSVTPDLVRLTFWAGALRGAATPTAVHLELRHRETDAVLALPSRLGRAITNARTHAIDANAEIALETLPSPGRWDLYVGTVTGAAVSESVRLGHVRSTMVSGSEHEARDALVRLDDAGLTIDVGYTASPAPAVIQLVGAGHDVDGLAELRIESEPGEPPVEVWADLRPAGSRDAPFLLPSRLVAPGTVVARLPDPGETTLRAGLVVSYGSRRRVVEPGPEVALRARGRAVGLQTNGDELLIVGRRRARTVARGAASRARRLPGAARRRARAALGRLRRGRAR